MTGATPERAGLEAARRIVVKVGTRVLVQRSGRPDPRRMRQLSGDLADLRLAGRDVVMVSSGAVGAGMEALGLKARPTAIPDLQMAAAVGQSRLMAHYDEYFGARRCRIGQVLLTHDDLKDRRRHLNARNTLMNLLRHGIVPIVNENDVVATEEIKFGDNDMLAALVALLMPADLLILLTTSDGLRAPRSDGRSRRVAVLDGITAETLDLARGKGSPLSVGGMATKLASARTVSDMGIPVVIADGRRAGVVGRILAGQDVGTLVRGRRPGGRSGLPSRKRWIAFFHKAQGTLVVDDGAAEAITGKGRSLLPIGILEVQGDFGVGALVNVAARDGRVVARGLVGYGSADIARIRGRRTAEIEALLGGRDFEEVIHRDNMALVP